MIFEEPFQQCHFVYLCFEDKEVKKTGWYVCLRVEMLDGKKSSWKVKSGPYKKDSLARSIGLEIMRDVGKPKRLEMKIFKLTKTKPVPKD